MAFFVTEKFENMEVNDRLIEYFLERERNLTIWAGSDDNGMSIYKKTKAFEWCAKSDTDCSAYLDPYRWEDDKIISSFIRKNTYRIVKKHFPDMDEMSLLIGWANILYGNQRIPGWHTHYYGENYSKDVISGNYYVDSNGTFTDFKLMDKTGNSKLLKIESTNGNMILFDGKTLHRVSGFDTFEKQNDSPRITFSFDILPKELVKLYFDDRDYFVKVGTHDINDFIGQDMYDYVWGNKSTGNIEEDLKKLDTKLNGINRPLIFWELQNG